MKDYVSVYIETSLSSGEIVFIRNEFIFSYINYNSESNHKRIPKSHTKSYVLWDSLDRKYSPSCISSGSKLQLCKVSSISVHLLNSSCAYEKYGQVDNFIPIYPPKTLFAGYTVTINTNISDIIILYGTHLKCLTILPSRLAGTSSHGQSLKLFLSCYVLNCLYGQDLLDPGLCFMSYSLTCLPWRTVSVIKDLSSFPRNVSHQS